MKVVIYARYSSDSQREESIEGQLRECKEYAKKNDITILGTYIDRALSARTDNRPEFQRMIRESAKHLFDTVLVWKLDRFARNRCDSATYINAVYLFDDKIVLTFNYKDGTKTVSLDEIENTFGSDLGVCSPLKNGNPVVVMITGFSCF